MVLFIKVTFETLEGISPDHRGVLILVSMIREVPCTVADIVPWLFFCLHMLS